MYWLDNWQLPPCSPEAKGGRVKLANILSVSPPLYCTFFRRDKSMASCQAIGGAVVFLFILFMWNGENVKEIYCRRTYCKSGDHILLLALAANSFHSPKVLSTWNTGDTDCIIALSRQSKKILSKLRYAKGRRWKGRGGGPQFGPLQDSFKTLQTKLILAAFHPFDFRLLRLVVWGAARPSSQRSPFKDTKLRSC